MTHILHFQRIDESFFFSAQQHCLECDNVEVYCTLGCGENMIRLKLQQHLQYQCMFRKIQCEYCSAQVEFIIYQVLFILKRNYFIIILYEMIKDDVIPITTKALYCRCKRKKTINVLSIS